MNIAAESGLDFTHFNGMSGELYMVEMMGGGVALLDYDNDGDLDVFLVQGRMLGAGKSIEKALNPPRHELPLTDRLYRNDLAVGASGVTELRFTDVTSSAIPRSVGYGVGAAAADYDNDGWVDLYVTNYGANQMLRNNGDGTFADVTLPANVGDDRWSVSAAFFDYDLDGHLDLYVANYLEYSLTGRTDCATVTGAPDYCSPLNYPPQKDALYRNRGDGTFIDVSVASGIETDFGPGLGVVAADFDGDGRPDVYVANDATENQLWINQADGSFVNDALLAGCAVNDSGIPEGSMGVAVADFNGDALLDLFMTHIELETNTLYLNRGGGVFHEATRRSGLGIASRPFTSFGTAAVDFDGDGWQDLFVANGTVQKIAALIETGDPYPLRQADALFRNRGAAEFERVDAGRSLGEAEVSRGVASGDLDLDGDEDLVVFDNAAPVRLLSGRSSPDRNWLGLRVGDGWRPFRDSLGATVAVNVSDGRRLLRRIATDGSYASASAPGVVIGGGAAAFEQVAITWPGGGRSVLRQVPAGRVLTVVRQRAPAP